MQSGSDPMNAPASFAARRPNASTLPSFELPPPPLAGLQHKFQNYSNINTQLPVSSGALASVGNLLTPPSNGSADGLSPSTQLSQSGMVQPYTPNSSASMSYSGSTPYGFQPASQQQQPQYGQNRIYTPSLNTMIRGNGSPSTSDLPPPPTYESYQYPATSLPMSAPPGQAQQMMMAHTPVTGSMTHPSPVSAQESFRPLPTPTYHSAPQSSTSQHGTYAYSTGPSPIHQSPVSAGPLSRPSPVHGHGSIPPLHAQAPGAYPARPFTYPGPILSNVSNPAGGLTLVNSVQNGMPMGYNSGHAAMQQMYHTHPAPPNAQNDRPFRCDQCPQSFNRNHDLKRHKRIHLAVKPFPCGHCDKSFSRKDALKRHVLVKGCGKAQSMTEVKEVDGSTSPSTKSEHDSHADGGR